MEESVISQLMRALRSFPQMLELCATLCAINDNYRMLKTQAKEHEKQRGEFAKQEAVMREFSTGATRDVDTNKFDYEGFLSPLAMEAFAKYMHSHRFQADGQIRDSDNWQKGIPKSAYMKSAWRHFMDMWKEHRGIKTEYGLVESLCALMFNVMGYLHETLVDRQRTADMLKADAESWTSADEDKIYTHRYGALAHDQEAIEDEEPRFKSPLPPQGYGAEVAVTDHYPTISSVPLVVHSKVLGVPPLWTASEVAAVAAEVRNSGFPQATIRSDGSWHKTNKQPPEV